MDFAGTTITTLFILKRMRSKFLDKTRADVEAGKTVEFETPLAI